jgi:hypothetical protein
MNLGGVPFRRTRARFDIAIPVAGVVGRDYSSVT